MDDIRLFPPYQLTQQDLLTSLGMSPDITVSNLIRLQTNNWAVNITSESIELAICVAFITKPYYTYSDGSTLTVRFYASDCNQRIPTIDQRGWNSIRLLSGIYNRALLNNPYFSFVSKDADNPLYKDQLFVYLTPDVIQYYCDNPNDLFGYCHFTAAQVFERILYDQFFNEINVSYNTSIVTSG